ncbi:MAG: hypothetical protein AAFX87_20665 [Bacteroidota bacterium]
MKDLTTLNRLKILNRNTLSKIKAGSHEDPKEDGFCSDERRGFMGCNNF